jgi:hypothetical protein
MINKIKKILGSFFLRREIKRVKRDREFFNLEMAKNVGIVYLASSQKDYDRVKTLTQYLKQRDVRVLSIGFIENPDMERNFKTQLEYRFFAKKDLNWYFKPNCLEVRNFISNSMDILIDLSLSECLSTQFVAGCCIARFKVGLAHKIGPQLYDMTIDVGNNKTLDYVIGNVKSYLDMINQEHQTNKFSPYA